MGMHCFSTRSSQVKTVLLKLSACTGLLGAWPSADASSELCLGPSSLGDAPLWVLGSHSCLRRGSVGSGGCGPSCRCMEGDQKIMTARIEFVSFLPQTFSASGSGFVTTSSRLAHFPSLGRGGSAFPSIFSLHCHLCPAPLLMSVLLLVPCVPSRLPFSWDWSQQPAVCSLSAFLLPPGLIWLQLAFLGCGVPHYPCNFCSQ